MEKKLRMKLEEELQDYRDAAEREKSGRRSRRDSGSQESLTEIRRRYAEAEEKVKENLVGALMSDIMEFMDFFPCIHKSLINSCINSVPNNYRIAWQT